MARHGTLPAALVAALVVAVGGSPVARAGDALTTLKNPGGGKVVYGQLTGVSSLPNAMGRMLRTIHSHFGDRPTLGRFFQARDSNSVAAFFTLTAKAQDGGPIAGLAIVSMPDGKTPVGAVLYDEASRFAKTEPAMMKALINAWHTQSAKSGSKAAPGPAPAAGPVHSGPAAPLRMATGGDRSASIGLPTGWHLTGVSGGQLTAEGSNGEMVALGLIYGQLRFPIGDLFQTFVGVSNQIRARSRLPPGAYKLTSSQTLAANPTEGRVIQVLFEVDFHDDRGPRKGSARLGAFTTQGVPTWAMTVSTSNAPSKLADAESKTMLAIIRSYSQDSQVIARETSDTIAQIHASAQASQIRANAQQEANDASNRAFDAHMDDLDRSSKSFENYQLDQVVVRDADYSERGTVSNNLGDALVKANPDRFQYVNSEDYIKGVDY